MKGRIIMTIQGFASILIFLVLVFAGAVYARGYLLLNDITTTPENAPTYPIPIEGKIIPSYNIANKELQMEYYPNLKPLFLNMPCKLVISRIVNQARKIPNWEILSVEENKIQVVASTFMMKFKDDVVIELRPASEGCEVHMRSRSRIGKGDFGTNARRIKSFLNQIQDEFQK